MSETDIITQMTNDGATRKEICAALGLSLSGVRYRQDRLGLRPAADRPKVHQQALQWSPEVQALWDGPMKKTEIAAALGVGKTALATAAMRAGVPPRPNKVKRATPAPVDPMAGMTAAQIADVNTLRKSRYSLKEAVAMVTAPKAKVRLATPSQHEARA